VRISNDAADALDIKCAVIYAECGVLQDLCSHDDKRKKYIILCVTPFSFAEWLCSLNMGFSVQPHYRFLR
jgi:hypothetical protein